MENKFILEQSGDYFRVVDEAGGQCDVAFSGYDGSMVWLTITPPNGKPLRWKFKVELSAEFIGEMHKLNATE